MTDTLSIEALREQRARKLLGSMLGFRPDFEADPMADRLPSLMGADKALAAMLAFSDAENTLLRDRVAELTEALLAIANGHGCPMALAEDTLKTPEQKP